MGAPTGIIFDIKKYSIHDGPGIRTTVFLKGCPLSCWWCHNPEGQSHHPEIWNRQERCILCDACVQSCPEGAISRVDGKTVVNKGLCNLCGKCIGTCYSEALEFAGREMTVAQVLKVISQDQAFYDQSGGGVTFSGGEPLLQYRFLIAMLEACKENAYHTAIDTSGFAAWTALDCIRDKADLFLYDLKAMDPEKHKKYTGVSNVLILENLRKLSHDKHNIIVRMPIIPGINDGLWDIHHAGEFLASLPSLLRVDLLPYHRVGMDKYRVLEKAYQLPDLQPPRESQIDAIASILVSYGLNVKQGS